MTGITNPTEEYFKDGTWGWDGTQWRKLGLLWGYSDRYVERAGNESAAAGYNVLASSTVPAGEVWVVQGVVVKNVNTATQCNAFLVASDTGYALTERVTLTPDTWYCFAINPAIMKAGDYLTTAFFNCQAGDGLYMDINGYKMKVT